MFTTNAWITLIGARAGVSKRFWRNYEMTSSHSTSSTAIKTNSNNALRFSLGISESPNFNFKARNSSEFLALIFQIRTAIQSRTPRIAEDRQMVSSVQQPNHSNLNKFHSPFDHKEFNLISALFRNFQLSKKLWESVRLTILTVLFIQTNGFLMKFRIPTQ